ncbi:hypothetical protein ACFQ3S_16800 [Mucilaginibacter terrae]|uniref:hypothetical protein n=1 Tax=Mucilaginibacter terrae TaxID=1955052 RepID=UPI0036387AB9
MNNYQLHEIFYAYEEAYTSDPYYVINFMKKNAEILHQENDFDEIADLKKYLAIVSQYIKALVDTGRYNKAIDEALYFLPVIEKNMIYLHINPAEETWYLSVCFQKGYAHYQLSDYFIALKQFKILLEFTPDSDQIKMWIDHSRYGTYKRYLNFIIIIASVLIFCPILFRNVLSPIIKIIMIISGLVLLALHTWLGYSNKSNKRVTN